MTWSKGVTRCSGLSDSGYILKMYITRFDDMRHMREDSIMSSCDGVVWVKAWLEWNYRR